MSASIAIVRTAANERSELPPIVARKIVAFLAAGHTGQIVLDVKEGRVLAYKLTESGRVPAAELDSNAFVAQDLER